MRFKRLRQFFCRHRWDKLYEFPDISRGESGYIDHGGLVLSGEIMCLKCYKVRGLISI